MLRALLQIVLNGIALLIAAYLVPGIHYSGSLWYLLIAGLVLGAVGAIAFTRLLENYLFGTTPTDVSAYVAVAALFFVTAIMATLGPARRATTIDPLIALRSE